MSSLDGTEPIADDEILYRRIPVSQKWFDPQIDPLPSPKAFRPRDDDTTGLSLFRGEPYNTAQQAGKGRSPFGYYVAVLRVRDLRLRQIEVVPRPDADIPGHVEIPALTAGNRETDEALNLMVLLAHELCLRVEGPFLPDAHSQT
jgi:hypothetical protein